MTILQIIGLIMMSLPLVAMFLLMSADIGLRGALFVLVVTIVIVSFVTFGAFLLTNGG